ncbi:tetratricopeptide repeat protein [Marinobacterium sediminicola]|uniref:Flp pilus assembly protein TadD, contains TPR repeats n=1 Tax=Marinobacterium sediminicola TaxID=518898 RepID=A0ABY1RZY0_9GAMM|nr:tetratricopeptide repeat protein [Marinobacterium sediminicola]ULG69970.1 tetratricopeptide repeat protein [Marinobacterium sediminicola]SMR74420.1 Flp pilus assembly protein TadD, contains TPR repeats [Marinobacterium sediminicola]
MMSGTVKSPLGKGLLLMTVVLLAGCAANSQMEQTSSDNDAFYEGKPTLAYSGLPRAATVKQGIIMGDQALARGETDEALYHYVQVLDLESESAAAYFRIGQVHIGRGNEKLASLALRSALGIEPEHIGALTALGVLHLKHNRYSEARTNLDKALELDRKRFEASAEQQYDARSPSRAYNGLGVLADLDGNTAEAQRLYQISLSIRPDAADTLNNLGYSYYLDARWDDAERQFRKALEIDPEYDQVWRNLGLVYARQQRYLAALNALERVMDSAKAHNDIGYICMLDGRYSLAKQYFEKAMTLSPTFYPKAKENLTYVERLQEAAREQVGR